MHIHTNVRWIIDNPLPPRSNSSEPDQPVICEAGDTMFLLSEQEALLPDRITRACVTVCKSYRVALLRVKTSGQ